MPSQRKGNRCLQASRGVAAAIAALALAGCAGQMAYREANELTAQNKLEAALPKYQQAIAADPGNAIFKAAFFRARDRNTSRLTESGDRKLAAGQVEAARQDYQRALALDPANERGLAGMRLVESNGRLDRLMVEAEAAFAKKDYDTARLKTTAVLTERPNHEPARLLAAQVAEASAAPAETGLAAAFKKPISIEFRDASLKQVFDLLSSKSGLNFVFDRDVKTDQKTTISLKNTTIESALYYVLMTNQLEQQVIDGNSIMIFPNLPAKLKDYQDLTIKTFYLANADAKAVANSIKVLIKSRDVVVDEKLNLVIVRDSPEAIRAAARLVAVQDVPEPEVMLEVEILEVNRSRAMDLGIAWPTSLALAPLTTAGGAPLTLDALRSLGHGDLGVTGVSATISANKVDGDSNTLANPRIRVRNREKAKIVIGEKVPNITTIVSPGAGGFASESVNYVDVGLTLNVEPTIYLNNEVAIRVALEVSNIVDSIQTKSGTVAYRLGTRSATTMLQLKDGENQVLAGLINNEDRSSGTKIPGLGNLPILGRLFGSNHDATTKSEIVLSITPHLVRNIQRPAQNASEFYGGSEQVFRRRPDAPQRPELPARPVVGAPAAVQPAPAQLAAPVQIPPPPQQPMPIAPPPAQSAPLPVQITPLPTPGAAPAQPAPVPFQVAPPPAPVP
ncbi:MAG: secretin N-terminal domain-containing protein [Massilia sp.]